MSATAVFGTKSQITTYRVELQVVDKLIGGVPSSRSVIEGWLKTRLGLGDRALQELADATLAERFQDHQPTADELAAALADSEAAPSINGFKRNPDTGMLAYESRCMKAALKEFANSAFPGTKWPGKTAVAEGFRKGLMATLAERVFVEGVYLDLGVVEPSGVEERIKHVMTPKGPRSSIARVEYVNQPKLTFDLAVHDNFLPLDAWGRIWERGEGIGIGADRGRSDGRFELLAFDKVS